jgi:D-alanyl-D-alanine carboxypeptidase
MTRITMMALPLAFLSAAAWAQESTTLPDANGDGVWSMEELTASVPDLTAETFTAIDTNADGSIDQAELDAAVAAGTIKPAT